MRKEPSAAQRNIATEARGQYLAFLEAGFTKEEALTLTRGMMEAAMGLPRRSENG